MGNWVAGIGANLEEAAVGGDAGAEPEAEPAAMESWWEVIYGNAVEGVGRAVELGVALKAFAEAVGVDGAERAGDWGWSG